MTDPRVASLQQAVPDLRLKTDAADLEHYGRDWTRRWTPAPLAIALPASVEEVQAVMRWSAAEGVAVVPSGGRTGLSGGAVAANGDWTGWHVGGHAGHASGDEKNANDAGNGHGGLLERSGRELDVHWNLLNLFGVQVHHLH